MEFFRPEYWSGWPFPSPGHLPNPGIESRSPALQVDSLPAEPQVKPQMPGGIKSICKKILNHWATMEVQTLLFFQWIRILNTKFMIVVTPGGQLGLGQLPGSQSNIVK